MRDIGEAVKKQYHLVSWLATIVLLSLYPGITMAADDTGKFAIKGAGIGSCAQYIEAREQRSKTFYNFSGWMDGYLTAVNVFSQKTFDIVQFESSELLTTVLARHCKNNPSDRFIDIVRSMVKKLEKNKIPNNSPIIRMRIGDRIAPMYKETIRRIQNRLLKLGLYKGEINGLIGTDTNDALKLFQKKNQLEITGLPDQLTLFQLFYPST